MCCPWVHGGWVLDALGQFFHRRCHRPLPCRQILEKDILFSHFSWRPTFSDIVYLECRLWILFQYQCPPIAKGLATNYLQMGLPQLETWKRYTYVTLFYNINVWFHIFLPRYVNSNGRHVRESTGPFGSWEKYRAKKGFGFSEANICFDWFHWMCKDFCSKPMEHIELIKVVAEED